MSDKHRSVAILASRDFRSSEAFYARLGFQVISDYGRYLILSDDRGWHLHLTAAEWPGPIENNPFGLFLYVDDVDAVADRVRDLIHAPGAPELKPWGVYEFAISDPDGTLIRIGRIAD